MNRAFTVRSLVAGIAIAASVHGSVQATCWSPEEITADQVKDFQYMMMVGALQCRNGNDGSTVAYNDFVAHQRGILDSKAFVLKAHFLRENGVRDGRAAYDAYNTAMSNRHAGRIDTQGFCPTIASYTHMAATLGDADFVLLAASVIEPPASSCGAAVAAPAVLPVVPALRRLEPAMPPAATTDAFYGPDPYAGLPQAQPAPQSTMAALPAEPSALPPMPAVDVPSAAPVVDAPPAAPMPVAAALPRAEVIPAMAVAAPRPSSAPPPARVTVIADAPVVPPEPARAANPTEALQAAIVALQAATAALKAQAGPTS